MLLLEVISGETLPKPDRGKMRFHKVCIVCFSTISKQKHFFDITVIFGLRVISSEISKKDKKLDKYFNIDNDLSIWHRMTLKVS
jgi:hypothetical protein